MRLSRKKILGLMLLASFSLSACGRKTVESSPVAGSAVLNNQPLVPPTPIPNPTPTPTPTPTPGGGGSSPLSYEIYKFGGSAVFESSSISTDNRLQIRYEVGPAGNQVFDGTDVRVEISVNGSTRVPKYTKDSNCPSGGCEYGRPSDGPSEVLDFSGSLTPGVPVVVRVTQARYNWYCYTTLYPGPIGYNPYEGCNYRLVLDPFNNGNQSSPGHYWRGRLIVATNATNMTQFLSNNP
jgi:hypothetical protein